MRSATVGSPAVTAGTIAARAQRKDQRQRPGPVARGELLGALVEHGQLARHRQRGDMDDQRVEVGPALGAEDRRHRRLAVGARGEAVDGLGRHRDQAPGAQQLGRAGDPVRVRRQPFGCLAAHRAALQPPPAKPSRASLGRARDVERARHRAARSATSRGAGSCGIQRIGQAVGAIDRVAPPAALARRVHELPDDLLLRGDLEHAARRAFGDQRVAVGQPLRAADVGAEEVGRGVRTRPAPRLTGSISSTREVARW